MKVDLHDHMMAAAPIPYAVVTLYVIVGCVWLYLGWLPIRDIGRRARAQYPEFEDFVQIYLLGRGPFFTIQSGALIPLIASGVVHRSFWGRTFRNLQPADAEHMSQTFSFSPFERLYSRFMLIHFWIVTLGMTVGFLLIVASYILSAAAS